MKIVLVVLSVLSVFVLSAQNVSLREKSKQLILDECPVCRMDKGKQEQVLNLNTVESSSLSTFHNFHTYVVSGNTEKALELAHFVKSEAGVSEGLIEYLKGYVFLQEELLGVAEIHFENSLQGELNEVLKANSRLNLALINQEKKEFGKALFHLRKAEEIYSKVEAGYNLKAVYKNFALCYLHSERYLESKEYYLKVIDLEKTMKDTLGLATSYMDLANLYYVQYKDELAIPLFEKGLDYAQRTQNLHIQRTANLNMSVVEENRGDFKKSLRYRKKYEKLVDSIWNRDKIWELAEHQKKFAVAQKQKEIAILEKEKKIKEVQRSYFLGLFVLAVLFLAHLSVVYRRRVKQNKVVMTQKEELDKLNSMKDRMFSIVAHDLKSPLNSLKTIHENIGSALTNNEVVEAKRLLELSQKNLHQVYLLLDNVLHWAMSQLKQLIFNRQITNLNAIVSAVCENYQGVFQVNNQTLLKKIPDHIFLNIDQGTFKIVLRNLIDNAIKYNKNSGTVSVSAALIENDCVINIQDDGHGVSPCWITNFTSTNQNNDGRLGLSLVKLFVEKNRGEISVESKLTKGTIFSIRLPFIKF